MSRRASADHLPRLCPLSYRVHDALAEFTSFPWPIMRAQCRRHGIDAAALTPTALGYVLQDLALGVARFNDNGAGMGARRALVALLREVTSAGSPHLDGDSAKVVNH